MLIDGVFSGGGLKGFSLVGAYQVLEEKNYRFKRVAGTSAGAIMAAFIAAGYSAKEIEQLLDELNLTTLLDTRKMLFNLPFLKWLNVYRHMGIYRGVALEKWFYRKLADRNIYTFSDLPPGTLKVVASDLSNGKIMVLPDDLINYGINANEFLVARALRMSCSIPFFFEPVILKVRNKESIIVDGGVLSNFPFWIFDNPKGKRIRPLLGIKLSSRSEHQQPRKINNGLQLFESLFTTMKDAHDQRYISRRHERDIMFIPVEEYNATQFAMDEETKEELIVIGRTRAQQFLMNWPKVRLF
ncbi:patatin-like phospholipase family protein [Metasolibacillus sp.]|uniref:patatin-like phospholipase family protein n=1 Tax=Metasolibacillus sp. TaxID=2703680 RepID=UPI0025FC5D73|nr:patatin-like phospholipase family protein [Metasolibacillus sp.]MCT6925080.1 patatin-like phospholipase family protein [Metasolibacillus sp.]MCT6941284.1 patatin-like phospholipase family protein [Metasolibacillus sp.]